MKKRYNLRELLGLTQKELASVLKISRVQLAMYEIGKRDLPLSAMKLLAEMLQHMQTLENEASERTANKELPISEEDQLKKLLKENEYQQSLIDRQVKAIEKKYNTKLKVLRLVDYLVNHAENKNEYEQHNLKSIGDNANKIIKNQCFGVLFQYRLKQELLVLEKILLEAELRKTSGITPN